MVGLTIAATFIVIGGVRDWLVTLLFGMAAVLTIMESTRMMVYLSGAVAFLLLLVRRHRGKVSEEVLEALDTTQPAREVRRS